MSLNGLRKDIDRVDAKILRLLNARARLALEVGALKKRQGRRLFDPKREQAILRRMARANHGPLPPGAVQAIYRQILTHVRRLERSA